MVKRLKDKLSTLDELASTDFAEQLYDRLASEVTRTANEAVKQINEIKLHRLRFSHARPAPSPFQNGQAGPSFFAQAASAHGNPSQRVNLFSAKWIDSFKRPNVLANDGELAAAFRRVRVLEDRCQTPEQETKNRALGHTTLGAEPTASLLGATSRKGLLLDSFDTQKNC